MYKITFDASYACVSRVRVSVWLETNTSHTVPDIVLREILDPAIDEVEAFMTQSAVRFSLDKRTCRAFHSLLKRSCEEELSLFSLEVSVSDAGCCTHPMIKTEEQREFHRLSKSSDSHTLYASFVRRLQAELLEIGIGFSLLGCSEVTELEK